MKQGLFHSLPPPLAVTPNCRFLMLRGTGVRVVGLVPRLRLPLPPAVRNWSWLCAGGPAIAMFGQDWLGAGHASFFSRWPRYFTTISGQPPYLHCRTMCFENRLRTRSIKGQLATCLRHSRHRAVDRNSLITLLTTPKNLWPET